MQRTCIALVDASRARLFMYERSADPEGLREQLSESTDLVSPARNQAKHDLFSDDSGGSHNGPIAYGFDDHRTAHIEQLDTEFARVVIAEIERLVRTTGSKRLVVCAGPRMLGTLRKLGTVLHREGLVLDELPHDLVKLTTHELRDQLASYGLLPPRPPRPSLAS